MNVQPEKRIPTLLIVGIVLIALCCCVSCIVAGAGYFLSELADGTGFLFSEPTIQTAPLPSPEPADFLDPIIGPDSDALQKWLRELSAPNTNYWELFGQLESPNGLPASRQPVQEPTEYQVGDRHRFWLGDEEEQVYWQTDADLVLRTQHAYFYVTLDTAYDQEQLQGAAELLESQILPTNHRFFGTEWTPGIDNDPRITILVTDQMPPGIAGYFSSSDEYPVSMHPRSNQREMIYVTSDYLTDLEYFGQLLSHELQHMIHWNQDQSESLWVNEGLSLLAEEVNGYQSVLGSWQFWFDPDIQLNNWAEEPDDRYRNYAASKLFLSYLVEHYGGYEILAELAADDAYGIDAIEHLLQASKAGVDFDAVFAGWTLANLLNDPALAGGRFSYTLHDGGEPDFCATLNQAQPSYAGWVSQYGTDYIEIDPRAGRELAFEGSALVRLAETQAYSGQFAWWSNRRNMLSSSLTRPVDLSQVETASLSFWTWYDIEENFDYGYVAVSSDQGKTWETLPGTHSSSDDPNAANYGHGYTGKSEVWLEEKVDLSAYAGQEILLRFWYITDPGLNQAGWLIDEISIPEIGFSDDGEGDQSGWLAEGFVRSSNHVPQRYLVHLVAYGPDIEIHRLELGPDNQAQAILESDISRAVLVVSGASRWTSETAPYRLEIRP